VCTLYSNPNKPEKEQNFFETFLSLRRDLHVQNPRRGNPPEPDFIFDLSQKMIGLEVTSPVKKSLAPIRTSQDECLKKAGQIAKQIGLEAIAVQVQFRSDRDPIDIDKAAEELVVFVKEKITKIDDKKYHHCNESGLKYSKWIIIRLGTVNGHTLLPHHSFERIHVNWLRTGIDEIQKLINKKQSKIPNYKQQCDECWLLIGVNEWTAPEAVAITDKLESHVFSGDFQRLFFLKNIEGIVVELKISSHI